jgi:bifunctional NMN adenylyltransferase/nudix hydrolase
MAREFDFLVFVLRGQPIHNGHIHIINTALERADRVILLLGSANSARSPRNPFTYTERRQMLLDCVDTGVFGGVSDVSAVKSRLLIAPINDITYNDQAWIAQVQSVADNLILSADNPNQHTTLHGTRDYKVGLIGFGKDGTGYYLKLFPEWGHVKVKTQYGTLNSTEIRADYLRRSPALPDTHLVPAAVKSFLSHFMLTDHFKWLVAEQEFYQAYKKSWSSAPYPPFICCADAVCIQSGHILLVRRAASPGKGLLALPGGHVEVNEGFRPAVIRELLEETRISDGRGEMPPAVLASYIKDHRMFDDPQRSLRGRVVTQAYLFEFPNRTELFAVLGSDDAEHAQWYPLGSLRGADMFEDHGDIIREMTGATPA